VDICACAYIYSMKLISFCVCEYIRVNIFVWMYSADCSVRGYTSADMGWLWLVGSLKLQVSFAKEPYKRDDILQQRPII